MSIVGEVIRLQKLKTQINSAIKEFNVDITDDVKYESYPIYLQSIRNEEDRFVEGNAVSVVEPSCTEIGPYAFYGQSSIVKAYFENATIIRNNAFEYCKLLSDIYFPNVTKIE
jgi:hypothetical protein